MRKLFIITIVLFAFWSCSTKKRTDSFISKEVHDTRIKEVLDSISEVRKKEVRETKEVEKEIIQVPYEVEVEVACDSAELMQKFSSGNTNLDIRKENGKLYLRLKNDSVTLSKYKSMYEFVLIERDSLMKIKTGKDSIVYRDREVISESEVVKTQWYDNIWRIIAIGIGVLWLFGITPKFIFKLALKLFGKWI